MVKRHQVFVRSGKSASFNEVERRSYDLYWKSLVLLNAKDEQLKSSQFFFLTKAFHLFKKGYKVNNHSKSVDVTIFDIQYLRSKWLNYINDDIKAGTWDTIMGRRVFKKVSSTGSIKCLQVGGMGRLSRSS